MQLTTQGKGGADPATFPAADVELEDTLDNLDGAENYARWIFGLLEPFLGEDVVEVGAGHGTFTQLLAQRPGKVVATDLSERCASILRDRFCGVPNVEVVFGDVRICSGLGPFDSAILINVLEHIEDDDAALRSLWESLKPGGRLVLWVPAFPALYAEFDRKVGHFRRYQLVGLKSQLSRAGFTVVKARYANAIGAVAWWVVARVLRGTPTRHKSVALFDRYGVPVVRWIESRWQPPFGQSIFAVAVRPEGPNAVTSVSPQDTRA